MSFFNNVHLFFFTCGESIGKLVSIILEETGLEIKVGKLLFTKEFIHAPLHAIELYFMITIVSGILTKGLDPEMNTANQLIEDVRWISLKNPDFVDEAFYLGINS